jgi:hypothetical protein
MMMKPRPQPMKIARGIKFLVHLAVVLEFVIIRPACFGMLRLQAAGIYPQQSTGKRELIII